MLLISQPIYFTLLEKSMQIHKLDLYKENKMVVKG